MGFALCGFESDQFSYEESRGASTPGTYLRIRLELVPYLPEVLCEEILLDRLAIDADAFSNCDHVR